jgi:GxxExxY protein
MNTNGHESESGLLLREEWEFGAEPPRLLLKEEVFHIVGAAMEVLNHLGHGFHEKPYENALIVEFGLRNIPWQQQQRFDLKYKGCKVGEFIPDLIAFNSIIVDAKVIDRITECGARADVELSENLRTARGHHIEFQTRKA